MEKYKLKINSFSCQSHPFLNCKTSLEYCPLWVDILDFVEDIPDFVLVAGKLAVCFAFQSFGLGERTLCFAIHILGFDFGFGEDSLDFGFVAVVEDNFDWEVGAGDSPGWSFAFV